MKNPLKIDIIANDGSPLGVTEQSLMGIDGRNGVGGAEQAILTLCRGWHNRGHDVTFYNNPSTKDGSVFKQKDLNKFRADADRDILIVFRSPNDRSYGAKGKKIWLSTDQFTVGDFKQFSKTVDKIVCISPHHARYFLNVYGIMNTTVIDLPVRTWEFEYPVEKVKNSCVFTSVPDRGLLQLVPIWKRIIEKVPDATLTITSDWSLWTGYDMSHALSQYKMAFAGLKGIIYKGAVKRTELVDIIKKSEFHLYPCTYEELFCLSVADCQVAGSIPITSNAGSLSTTNRLGHIVDGIPTDSDFIKRFSDLAIGMMTEDRPLPDISATAISEFGLEKVLDEWDKIFYE